MARAPLRNQAGLDANEAHLREMLREAEEFLDGQIEGLRRSERKSERMLTLAFLALGGGILVGSLLGSFPTVEVEPLILAILLGGGTTNVIAVFSFIESYVGFREHTDVYVGPSVEWLAEKSRDRNWTFRDHVSTLIFNLAAYQRHNAESLARMTRWNRHGVFWLTGSVIAYAAAFILIVGGWIL